MLEVGVAYSVWTGIGAAGTFVMGVVLFGETLSAMKLAGIALVLDGDRRAQAGLDIRGHLCERCDGIHIARGAGLGGGDHEF